MGGVFKQDNPFAQAMIGGPAILGSKFDPGGTVLGAYGKHPKDTPIDPLAFTGIYGYDIKTQPGASDNTLAMVAGQNTQNAITTSGQIGGGTGAPQRTAAAMGMKKKSNTSSLLGD